MRRGELFLMGFGLSRVIYLVFFIARKTADDFCRGRFWFLEVFACSPQKQNWDENDEELNRARSQKDLLTEADFFIRNGEGEGEEIGRAHV